MKIFKPETLKCGYMTDPIGIDDVKPLLSWTIAGTVSGIMQAAYRISASRNKEALIDGACDLWDSGEVESSESFGITYGGKTLKTGEKCWWIVMVRDIEGDWSEPSETAYFEAGIMDRKEWKASFIGLPEHFNPRSKQAEVQAGPPLPLLRKNAVIMKAIRSALAYVT